MQFDPPKSPADFWADEEHWPREDRRFYFLARAVNMVGETLFQSEWTCREPYSMAIRLLPERQAEATGWEKQVAASILREKLPDATGYADPINTGTALSALGQGLTTLGTVFLPDHWAFARSYWDQQVLLRKPIIDRKRAVIEWFVERICDDKLLRAVVQDRITLQPFLDAPENWNLKWQKLETRFRDCAYTPASPSSTFDSPTHDVFVFREDLDRLLSAIDCDAPQGQLALEGAGAVDSPTPTNIVTNNAHTTPAIALVKDKIIETDDSVLRDDAYKLVLTAGLQISNNHFRNKVWPIARVEAGKPKGGTPGPKRSAVNSAG